MTKKKRRVRRRRKSTEQELAHARKMRAEWETKRRLADTKVRQWDNRVKRYDAKFQAELVQREQKIRELERQVAKQRKREITFE